jgi:hypothetical protein
MRTWLSSSAYCGLCVLMTACGGGGSGGSSSGGTNVLPAVAITDANSPQVATTAQSGTNARNFGANSAQSGGATNNQVTVLGLAKIAGARAAGDRRFATATLAPRTIPCSTGSVTGTLNDADNSGGASVGDGVALVFNNCFESRDGTTTNGNSSLTLTEFSGDPFSATPGWRFGANIAFTNFSVSTARAGGTENVSLSGNLAFSETGIDASTSTGTLSTNDFIITDSGDSVTLSNYSLTFTQNNATNAYSVSGQGKVSSRTLNGSFDFVIPQGQPLTGTDPNPPDSGVIRVTGQNSNATVTAIGNEQVRLEVDSNNDGVTDNTRVFAWSDLP